MKRPGIIAIAVFCGAGCSGPPSRLATSGANGTAAQTAGDAGATVRTDGGTAPVGAPPAPIPVSPNCQAYVSTTAPLSTAWVDEQVANGTCSGNPPTVAVTNGVPSASILYADCTPIGNIPSQCTLAVDMQTCSGGYWTKLCQHNSDCPTGTLCVSGAGVGDVPPTNQPQFGTCAKECNVAGSAQCGRCGLVCDMSTHVCTVPIPTSDGGVP